MDDKLELTYREARDLQLALYYSQRLDGYGAANHSLMMLIAKLATRLGIALDFYAEGLELVQDGIITELGIGKKPV